jgi:hypothetical protein
MPVMPTPNPSDASGALTRCWPRPDRSAAVASRSAVQQVLDLANRLGIVTDHPLHRWMRPAAFALSSAASFERAAVGFFSR